MLSNIIYRGHILRIAFGVAALAVLLLAGIANAATWTVDDSGGANYTTIQDAIDNANAGDTILVYSGTYYENVNVNKQLILRGIDNGGGKPVVDASGSGNTITLDAGDNTLEGFIAVNAGGGGNAGIYLNPRSQHNMITNNIVSNNQNLGILLDFSHNNTLSGNNVSNNNFGISLRDSTFNTLSNNNVSNNNFGIFLSAYSSFNILNINTIKSNTNSGIALVFNSNNNTIYNNYFNNTNNAQDEGYNIWNISKTAGTNIIGGPYLGGNFWSDYAGKDLDGDGMGDTQLPYNNSGNIINGGDYLPLTPISKVEGIIQGTIYNDSNRNKIRNEGEEGLANWIIELRGFDTLTKKPVKNQTITDINGDYSFTNLNPGRYIVHEMPQPKWVPTTLPTYLINLSGNKIVAVDFGNRRT